MTSSRSHHPRNHAHNSRENTGQSFAAIQRDLLEITVAGSMNDSAVIRAALIEAIRKCGKSREDLADEMTALSGTEVTVRRLNAYTAESREDYRFPLELVRAFCAATGDFTLLAKIAELSGSKLIGSAEIDLMHLGAEYLRQKRAITALAELENRLGGLEL
jgi:hypothetical protein